MQLRQYSLIIAEALDAWRVVPRIMLICYGWIVLQLYIWFKSIPTYVQEKCDPTVLSIAIAKHLSLPEIKALACTVVDVVGGPTAAQSAFVTTIIGLSTGIFGLYTATGRRWDGWKPSQSPDKDVDKGGGDDNGGDDNSTHVHNTEIKVYADKKKATASSEPNGPEAPDTPDDPSRPQP